MPGREGEQLRIGVITNPNSRKNRFNPGRFDLMRDLVGGLGVVRRTHHTGEIAEVVHDFLDQKIPYWVADGGDGAFHWLVNVLTQVMAERGGKDAMPAIMATNAGTIDFIGRKVGLRGDAEGLLRALCQTVRAGREPDIVELDTFVLRGVHGPDSDWPGKPFVKVGFAGALAGISQRFFDKFYAQEHQTAGGILEIAAKVLISAGTKAPVIQHLPVPISLRCYSDSVFEPMPLDVWVDGELLPMRLYRDVDVGAIDINIAGVFRFFPFARERGILHVQCGNPSPLEVVRNLPRMAAGKPLSIHSFVQRPARTLKVVARDGRRIDPVIDGELYWGLSECEVGLGPTVRAVRVRAG